MNLPLATRLSQRTLKTLLAYDPATGVFTWLVTRARGALAGDEAGTIRKDGHITITIKNHSYTAQRLAWLYMKGEMPAGRLTFRDGNPTNTKWQNIVAESTRLSDTFSARYQRDLRRRNKAAAAGEPALPDPELGLRFKRTPPRRKPASTAPAVETAADAAAEWSGKQ